jgi:two-component system CheB/CheR fusion protein
MNTVDDYAIITLDAHGRILSWNDGARGVFGWEAVEAIGQPVAMIFTPEDRAAGVPEAELRQARESGRAEDDRWQLRKDGTRIFVSGVAAPLADAQQVGYVKVCRDVTAQQAESSRRDELLVTEQSSRADAEEASRLKDDFLAVLSHELRNPLSLVLMQSEILLRAPETVHTPRLRHAAEVIHEMVQAQAQLVADMLDVSRARTGNLTLERQLVPLSFVIADSIGALRQEAERKGVTLELQVADPSLVVAADPLRLRQIGWNLVTNAIKFTPAGGNVEVRLGREDDDARLDVADSGLGMTPDVAARVFEWTRPLDMGMQGPQTGLGIGLALVRQLVELHGGRVAAHSDGLGKGSRFSAWLPLQAGANVPTDSPGRGTSGSARLHGVRVLLVDDSEDNAAVLAELLTIEGAQVCVETSAAGARSRGERQAFDMIVSDIDMPGGDGYGLLQQIRRGVRNADILAVAYSGYGSARDIERAHRAGFDAHVTKPASLEQLLAAIHLARSRRDARAPRSKAASAEQPKAAPPPSES